VFITFYTKNKRSKYLKFLLLSFALVVSIAPNMLAQPIPIGGIKDQQYRTLQLLSDSTIQVSLMNRPIWEHTYRKIFDQKKIQYYSNSWWANPLESYEKHLHGSWKVGIYTPVLTNTFNTMLPHGGNNGSAWYGRGLTTELQGGFYITSKYVTATFRPHLTYVQNKNFQVPHFIPRNSDGSPKYASIIGDIDMPYRFGPNPYTDFNFGLTSLRVHYKSLEAGLSNGTMWWGPGIKNALLLSNNAPGLKHAFIGTRAPITLPLGIGKFEFKILAAEPKDSKYFHTTPATNHQRFYTAFNLIYSPGFAPNLNIGYGSFSERYLPASGLSLSDFKTAIPIINRRQVGGQNGSNRLISFYLRWAFPGSDAEVYGAYYRDDSFANIRDLFIEPNHDRAYTVGFQKVVENPGGWFNLFKINGELSSLLPARVGVVRPQTYFYTHSVIKQGHTNHGQLLGAAIGPGSTSQYLGADGYFKKGKIGLFLQRVAKNNFFYFSYYRFYYLAKYANYPYTQTSTKDIYHNRVNLNIGLTGRYQIGSLMLGGKIVWNKNFNYGRFNYGKFSNYNFSTVPKHDVLNMQFQLSVRYYF